MASSWLKLPGDVEGGAPLTGGFAPAFGATTVIRTPTSHPAPQIPGGASSHSSVPNAMAPAVGAGEAQVWTRLFPSAADVHANSAESLEVAGTPIDHFQLINRLGAGGMGAVFLAEDTRLGREVALKILAPWQARDPAVVKRFQNEARAAAALDHEHIAAVYHSGEYQGLNYIAFEYVQGTNLRDLIQQKTRLSPAEAVTYTLQLASALTHTSIVGVVHRDIKPSNVIITPSGVVKLVDLGLARQTTGVDSNELTVAGTTLGTFDYISPEQARDPRTVDVRSDIYSLGCTLYHMLTGEPPYPEGTVLQKLLEHQSGESPDPAKKNRRVTPALSNVVRKMMESDPRRRYPNPNELIRDLARVGKQIGLRSLPTGIVMDPEPEPARFWATGIWFVTAVALIAFVLLIDRFPQMAHRMTDKLTRTEIAGKPNRPEAVEPASPVFPIKPINPPATSATAESGVNPAPRATASLPIPFDDDPRVNLLTPKAFSQTDRNTAPATVPPAVAITSIPPNVSPGTPTIPQPAAPMNTMKLTDPSPAVGSFPAIGNLDPPLKVEATLPLPVESAFPVWIEGGKGYPSLEAACAEAKEGSVIELRDHFRRYRERPIRIANKRLTIRGAPGHRPVLEFRPTTSSEAGMITLVGGGLELMNVEIEWNLSDVPYQEGWALLSLERSERLRLRNVVITVHNPKNHAVTVCELLAGPGSAMPADMKNLTNPLPPEMVISQSFIRGECGLIHVRDSLPNRITIEESLIAISEQLLKLTAARQMVSETARLELSLQHSTCLIPTGSLIVMRSPNELTDRLLPVHVTANNNLIACARDHALVEMYYPSEMLNSRQLFTWTGDRNFYDGFAEFWWTAQRDEPTPRIDPDKPRTGFDAWSRLWLPNENNSHLQHVEWSHPWRNQPLNTLTPRFADFDSDRNHAYKGAADGTNAGAPLEKLPPLLD